MAAIEPVPDVAVGDEVLRLRARVTIGVLGGFCAVLLKVYAQDNVVIGGWLLRLWKAEISDQDLTSLIGYVAVALLVMFLGGLVGFFVEEKNRLKMLALGMSAPAMLTTFTGGVDPKAVDALIYERPSIEAPPPGPAGSIFELRFIGTAYAGDGKAVGQFSQITEGFNVFLGRGPARLEAIVEETNHYWVIVGSERDPDKAQALAESINEQAPEFEAFVGQRKPENPYYPIIIGGEDGFVPRTEALQLRDRAIDAGIAPSDSYLSAFPDRLPVR